MLYKYISTVRVKQDVQLQSQLHSIHRIGGKKICEMNLIFICVVYTLM